MAQIEIQDKNTDEVQNNKLQIIGKLTASLLHEIRNPLSAIKLSLNYMEMFKKELSDEIFESIIACSEGVNRIQFLIDQLLGFSRKNQEDLQLLSINDITENALNLLDSVIIKNNITIEKRLFHNISPRYANENKLLQVFINLITNAIEASPSGGKIVIKTDQKIENDQVLILWEIEDNGIGISLENQHKIFDDFYTSKKEGTGLGLSVCKMLVEECGANIICESELDKGTKFRIKFNNKPSVNNEK